MTHKRIVFLILASEDSVNESDREAQQQTWCSNLPANIEAFWIRGHNNSDYRLSGSNLYVPCAEGYENILSKSILAVSWCLKHLAFDILIRTNVSTYYSIPHLMRELENFDQTKALFGGFLDKTRILQSPQKKPFSFVTGTGIYLTQPACELLVNLKPADFATMPDDVAITYFLVQQGLHPYFFHRVNMHSTHFFILRSQIRLKSSEISNLARKRFLLIFQYSQMPRSIRKIIWYLKIELQEVLNLQLTKRNLKSFIRRNSHIFHQNIRYIKSGKNRKSK